MQTNTTPTQQAVEYQLAEFWLPHLAASEDLFKHLEYVDKSSKEIKAGALRRELEAFDEQLSKEVAGSWRFKEYRSRTIITLAGKITYLRRIYTEPSGICHAYLDEVLGIRSRFKLAPDAFLWIAKMASDISFRKTAKAFFERTGAKISHWLVMEVMHEEGRLILEDIYQRAFGKKDKSADGLPLTTETLFVEFDGIHIPLQKSTHGPKKVRWAYEAGRKKNSFELKVGCAYAGKDSKGRRLGTVHCAFDEVPEYFWELVDATLDEAYDTDYVSELHLSSDAAGWCKNVDLAVMCSAGEATHHLDRFHLNREIRRAFGGKTDRAAHFITLAYERRMKRLFGDLQRVIGHATDKTRYLELQSYLASNRHLIENGRGPSMGCMEGTNAHVYAARMKVWGGAWSRRGAACMAAVRARIASGQELICPKPDNVSYDERQIAKRQRYELKQFVQNYTVPRSKGKGWEPPQGKIILTTHMPPHLYGVLNYT